MFKDPVFILALSGVIFLIALWISKVLHETLTNQAQQIIYSLGFLFALLGIYRIFVNAGDLGIILFLGSIICLLILLYNHPKRSTANGVTGRKENVQRLVELEK